MRIPATRTSEKHSNRVILKGLADAVNMLEEKQRNHSVTIADYSTAVKLLKKSHMLIQAMMIDNRQV